MKTAFALISRLLDEHGYQFRLWKVSAICAEPRLNNASLVLRYRRVQVEPAQRERIRRVFSATSEAPLGAFEGAPPVSWADDVRVFHSSNCSTSPSVLIWSSFSLQSSSPAAFLDPLPSPIPRSRRFHGASGTTQPSVY